MTTGNFILKMLNYKRKFKSDLPRQTQICRTEVGSGHTQYEHAPIPPPPPPPVLTWPLHWYNAQKSPCNLIYEIQRSRESKYAKLAVQEEVCCLNQRDA